MIKNGVTRTRIEKDSLGDVKVPADAFWGAQTQRSLENFAIGIETMPQPFIYAFALLKKIAAQTNHELGKIETDISNAIQAVCTDILNGDLDNQFPLKIWQTGSGTQTNMNLNEVIAYCANKKLNNFFGKKTCVHPNDHVNYGQSSNDCFPTAMNIAAVLQVQQVLLPALNEFYNALKSKELQFHKDIKVGRTHLQDATPITLGQEFSAYAEQIKLGMERIESVLPRLYRLAQGATAVGTGLNCDKDFPTLFAKKIAEATLYPFISAPNKFEAIATHDSLVELSGALNVLACSFMKIANDLRFLASGPRCGYGEINFPSNEPGSSIMPGKVNPTQAEAMTMVAAQIMGNHTTVTIAGSNGHFELNTFKPVIIYNILQSITLLSDSANSFVKNCLNGITVNKNVLKDNLDKCLMLITALNPVIGYDKAAKIAKYAYENNISLKQAVLDLQILTEEEFDQYVDVTKMI
ncbi:MAG TPA: class II fumarate hydratase [Holosporales bacterium]|nr:class II fumarate hydratase [Holosporales bacterium]